MRSVPLDSGTFLGLIGAYSKKDREIHANVAMELHKDIHLEEDNLTSYPVILLEDLAFSKTNNLKAKGTSSYYEKSNKLGTSVVMLRRKTGQAAEASLTENWDTEVGESGKS